MSLSMIRQAPFAATLRQGNFAGGRNVSTRRTGGEKSSHSVLAKRPLSVPGLTVSDNAQRLATMSRGMPWRDGDEANLCARLKINGQVVGRVFNSGLVEITAPHAKAAMQATADSEAEAGLVGPQLADLRITRLARLLGAETDFAPTAMAFEQWRQSKALTPGSLISKNA